MHLTHHYVAFAAGRGIEPLLPLIETLLARDRASSVQLFYGNRDREQTALAEELLGLKDRYLDRFALHFVMSREPQEIEWLNGRLDAREGGHARRQIIRPSRHPAVPGLRAGQHERRHRRRLERTRSGCPAYPRGTLRLRAGAGSDACRATAPIRE